MNTVYQSVALENIRESASNPRQHFDEKGMAELTESIRTKGVVAPLLLRPMEGFFELVDGARRYRAAKSAGLETVPAILRHMSDDDALEIQVIANLQRQDVHPLDEAEGYKRLLDTKRYDVGALAAKVGKSKAYIYGRLQLTNLVKGGVKLLLSDEITVAHALLICRLSSDVQKTLIDNDLIDWNGQVRTVNDLRRLIESEIMLDLASAHFSKKDPLLTNAGACVACTKRSGFDKELFSDITKKDLCTDAKCFAAKMDEHIKRAKKGGALPVSSSWDAREKGVLGRSQDNEPAKACKSKKKAVMVDGGGEQGKVFDVCTDAKCPACASGSRISKGSSSRVLKPVDRYKRRLEIHEARIEQAYRERVYGELLKIIAGPPDRSHLIMIISQINDRWSGHLPEIGKMVGLKLGAGAPITLEEWTKYFVKATDANLLQLICGIIMRQDLISDVSMGHDDADHMNLIGALHNKGEVDYVAIRKEVTDALASKKPKPPKDEKPAAKKTKKEVKDDE